MTMRFPAIDFGRTGSNPCRTDPFQMQIGRESMKIMMLFLSTSVALFLGGCVGEMTDQEMEEFATVEQGIVVGDWRGPFVNGDVGSGAMTWVQWLDGRTVVICEGFEAGDGRWHPGKLWAGQCRYDYNGGLRYSSVYNTLKKPSSYRWVQNQGHTPAKALGSTGTAANSLPLCASWGGTGKVWAGKCRFEWKGNRQETTDFKFLEVL